MPLFYHLFKKKKDTTEEELYKDVQEAWLRWQNAVEYFNSVAEPELVECAIHNVEATRIHYMYLVNLLRKKKGVSVSKTEVDRKWG
jgi:hypothetical protein